MKTKKLNINKEQHDWLKQHNKADEIIERNGVIVEAIYRSPMEKWKGHIDPDGNVNVPDMDYYNNLRTSDVSLDTKIQNIGEMEDLLDDL